MSRTTKLILAQIKQDSITNVLLLNTITNNIEEVKLFSNENIFDFIKDSTRNNNSFVKFAEEKTYIERFVKTRKEANDKIFFFFNEFSKQYNTKD